MCIILNTICTRIITDSWYGFIHKTGLCILKYIVFSSWVQYVYYKDIYVYRNIRSNFWNYYYYFFLTWNPRTLNLCSQPTQYKWFFNVIKHDMSVKTCSMHYCKTGLSTYMCVNTPKDIKLSRSIFVMCYFVSLYKSYCHLA